MPHLSSKKLSEAQEKILKDRLVEVLRHVGKNHRLGYALKELFTHTEMLMFAKRISIIYLANKEMPTLEICKSLEVSSSTVIKIQKRLDRGGYKNLIVAFRKAEPTILEIIESIMYAGSPRRYGKGRWDFLNN